MRIKRRSDESGFTLMETVVTMTIMTVVMAITTGALVQIYTAANRTEATSVDRDQLTIGFRRLDKELRYASWASTPGLVGSTWYLEYAVPAGCRELRFTSGVLTLWSWTLPSTTPASPAAIASGLLASATTGPFTVYTAGATPYASASAGTAGVGKNFSPEHWLIRLQFTITVGTVTQPLDVVFTAQNTNRLTTAVNDCSKGRPTS